MTTVDLSWKLRAQKAEAALLRAAENMWQVKNDLMEWRQSTELMPTKEAFIAGKIAEWAGEVKKPSRYEEDFGERRGLPSLEKGNFGIFCTRCGVTLGGHLGYRCIDDKGYFTLLEARSSK